jgi:hypothetical protein
MFARKVIHAGFTCAVTESLTVAHKEIYGVLGSLLPVGDSVLTEHAGWLYEQLPRSGSLRRLAQLFFASKLDHCLRSFSFWLCLSAQPS